MLSTRVLSVKEQEGFADDYSFLIRGLQDMYEASQVRNCYPLYGTVMRIFHVRTSSG